MQNQLNKCSYHPQEIQDIICLQINCAHKNLFCPKCLVQKHQSHIEQCTKLGQISNQFNKRLIENFQTKSSSIFENQFRELNSELMEFQTDVNQCKAIFDQKELQNIFLDIENQGEQFNQHLNTLMQFIKGKFLEFKMKEKIQMTLLERDFFKNQVEQTKELFQQAQHKITQAVPASNIQDFWQEYQKIQESKGQYVDKTTQDKAFYVYETQQRIQNLLNKPINFFCNERGQNVFASDGIEVKLDDIQARSTGKDMVFQLGLLLSSFCPKKLQDIFLMTEVNYSGFYGIKRVHMSNNQRTIMYFDDFVPLFQNEVILGKNNSIWITILEKAFAKINGSYSFFDSRPSFLLRTLFPIPLIKIWTSEENIDTKILEELKNNSLILIEPKSLQSTNFVHSNYVQITGVKYVQNPFFDEQVMLFELKNPAGRNHYQGDWGFQSPYWTAEVQSELKVKNYDDGIFYMDFVSFLVDVVNVESYRLYDEKVAEEFFILKSKQGSYFSLDVQQDSSIVMVIELQDTEKLDFIVAISQITESQSSKLFNDQTLGKVVFNKALSFSQFQSVPFNLSKGLYIMYVKIKSAEYQRQGREAQLMFFCQSPMSCQQSQKCNNFKQLTMKSLITQNAPLQISKDSFSVKRVVQKDLGWVVFEVKNKLQKEIKITFTLPENSKGKFAKPFQQKRNEITIRGQEEIVIIVKNDINAQLQFEAN